MRWRRRLMSRQRRAAGKVRETPNRQYAERIARRAVEVSSRALRSLRPNEEAILRNRFGVPDGKTMEDFIKEEGSVPMGSFSSRSDEPIDIEAVLSPKRPKPGGSGRIRG